MWTILSIAAGVVALICFWRGRNAVGGAMTMGLVIGLLFALGYYFTGRGFHWDMVGKGAAFFGLLGAMLELAGKKRRKPN